MIQQDDIEFNLQEDDRHTMVRVALTIGGTRFTGSGRARRNPGDPNVPMVGEELAAARAFSELSHHLVDAAAEAISTREGHPAHVHL